MKFVNKVTELGYNLALERLEDDPFYKELVNMDIGNMKLKDVSKDTLKNYLKSKEEEDVIYFDYSIGYKFSPLRNTSLNSSDWDNCELIGEDDYVKIYRCYDDDYDTGINMLYLKWK